MRHTATVAPCHDGTWPERVDPLMTTTNMTFGFRADSTVQLLCGSISSEASSVLQSIASPVSDPPYDGEGME